MCLKSATWLGKMSSLMNNLGYGLCKDITDYLLRYIVYNKAILDESKYLQKHPG